MASGNNSKFRWSQISFWTPMAPNRIVFSKFFSKAYLPRFQGIQSLSTRSQLRWMRYVFYIFLNWCIIGKWWFCPNSWLPPEFRCCAKSDFKCILNCRACEKGGLVSRFSVFGVSWTYKFFGVHILFINFAKHGAYIAHCYTCALR